MYSNAKMEYMMYPRALALSEVCLLYTSKEGKVSFKHVITFNMDEYVGLPESDVYKRQVHHYNPYFLSE